MPLNLITLKLIRGSQLIRDTDSAAKADDNKAAILARLAKRVDSFDCLLVALLAKDNQVVGLTGLTVLTGPGHHICPSTSQVIVRVYIPSTHSPTITHTLPPNNNNQTMANGKTMEFCFHGRQFSKDLK